MCTDPIPLAVSSPLSVDVSQLPHLSKFREFLMLDRPHLKRFVYEIGPDSMEDRTGYDEYRKYLLTGRGGEPRAGISTDMDARGLKLFILPPGVAARALGYKGDFMIAVLRPRA